jgi:hypothetical protein
MLKSKVKTCMVKDPLHVKKTIPLALKKFWGKLSCARPQKQPLLI